jgi:alkaline phosphatase
MKNKKLLYVWRQNAMRRLIQMNLLILLLVITGCTAREQLERPRNIILMIGDGMGTAHIYASMMANGGHLNLEQCEYVGFQKTYSFNRDITDSGASATAMSAGIKTRNYSVGVDPEGKPVKTILELAEENEISTGLVATANITHYTPAAFAAHNPDRKKSEEIALDMIRSGVDLLIGGGLIHFNRRADGLDLLDSLRARDYYVGEQISTVPEEHTGPLAIITDSMAMPRASDGRGELLAEATVLAMDRLSGNPDGFFLMVEGSQIDWAGHDNDTKEIISETIDFDKAVGKAIDFARKDGETLVIVTADHETGGFTILKGGIRDPEVEGAFSTGGHTGVMVPVFAYGPGAENFAGIYENTDIFHKMKDLLGL